MDPVTETISILVTLDENYIPYLNIMLSSLLRFNEGCRFDVYLLHTGIDRNAFAKVDAVLGERGKLIPVFASDLDLDNAPTTSRYPKEIYYRIFAARYLPHTLDRVLYLDPDLVVNGSLLSLWRLPMDDYYFAAASHTGAFLSMISSLRLNMKDNSLYINSGVMLMNLALLRSEQNYEEVFAFIKKRKAMLFWPDQDIISALYGSKIYALDSFRYNMTEMLYRLHAPFEKTLNLDWVRQNSRIIHYCGRNKPWKSTYHGKLDVFYREAADYLNGGAERGMPPVAEGTTE